MSRVRYDQGRDCQSLWRDLGAVLTNFAVNGKVVPDWPFENPRSPRLMEAKRLVVEWLPIVGEELLFASGAFQRNDSPLILLSEHALCTLVEARLAEVMQRLCTAWRAGPAVLWRAIHSIDKNAVGNLKKRVATTLRQGFLQFSQFLCGFEVLLLKLHELSVVREQSVLGFEQLLVDLSDSTSGFVKILERQSRLADLLRGFQRSDSDRNLGKVHETPR